MIIITTENRENTIANICEDIWDLPTQIEELHIWLKKNLNDLKEDRYIADIGFGIRPEASGGGAVLNLELLELLLKANMEIYLSEYNFE